MKKTGTKIMAAILVLTLAAGTAPMSMAAYENTAIVEQAVNETAEYNYDVAEVKEEATGTSAQKASSGSIFKLSAFMDFIEIIKAGVAFLQKTFPNLFK